MPKFQVLIPTVHIACIKGHQYDRALPNVFIPVDLKCKECGTEHVIVTWSGMKPHEIEGEKD